MAKQKIIAKQSPASENEFRLLAEAMPQIVWVTRADGWNTYFNQQWVDYTGLTLEESYGHGWNKPFHPEDQQRAWDAWQNAVTNNDTYSLECRLRRYDGIYRWWLIRGVPVFDKSGNILKWFGTCTDIDDIKQAESQIQLAAERERAAEALRESVRREIERAAELAALLDAAPVAIFIAHDPDCLHITGNSAADALLRNPKGGEASLAATGEKKPSHFRAFKDGRELSIDELPAQQAARGFEVRDFEFSLVFDNGITRNVVANGTPLRDQQGQLRGSVLVMVDITDRKLAEMALKESEERLVIAADAGQVGIFDLNVESGELLWTQQHEIIFGYEPTDTKVTTIKHTYQDWSTRVHPEDLTQVEERMRHATKAKSPFQVEYRLIWPDGSVHWVNVTSKYYFDSNGRCVRLMGAVRDITRQKQLEESLQDYSNILERKVTERTAELREKDQLLLQQSRLATMGEMINNIAHQWRQPLNVVGLYIQSLLVYYDNGNLDREFLKTITDDTMKLVNHMSQTIDDFRNFFKPDKDKEEFKITQVIESAIRLVDASFQDSHIKIVKNCADDTVAYGYPNEYSQVILNILSNAKDAILERKTENPVVSISSGMENGKSVVTISDNAGGIPEEIIFKVFDPHFSTKGPQGTGIGLFMAKNIIEKSMNGSLMVINNEEGAVFRIEV